MYPSLLEDCTLFPPYRRHLTLCLAQVFVQLLNQQKMTEEDSREPRVSSVINRDIFCFLSLLSTNENISLFSQLYGEVIYLKKIFT